MRPVARSIIRNAVSRAITDPGVGGGGTVEISATLGALEPYSAGSSVNKTSTWVSIQSLPVASTLREFSCYATATGTVKVKVLQPIKGGGFNVISNQTLTIASTGLNTFTVEGGTLAEVAMPANCLVGVHTPSSGGATISFKSGEAPGYSAGYFAGPGDLSGNGVALTTGATYSNEVQISHVAAYERGAADPGAYWIDEDFASTIAPAYGVNQATNPWSFAVAGQTTSAGTGLANFYDFYPITNADRCTFAVEFEFTGASDRFCVYRKPILGDASAADGTIIEANLANNRLVIYQAWAGGTTYTLPSSQSMLTLTNLTLTTGVRYRLELTKAAKVISARIIDTTTDDEQTHSADNDPTVLCGLGFGRPGFANLAGSATVKAAQFYPVVSNPRVLLLGDSITEGSGTADETSWAQLTLDALATPGNGWYSGDGGTTLINVLRRLRHDLRYSTPRYVVIENVNNTSSDALRDAHAGIMDDVIATITNAGAIPVIGMLTPNSDATANARAQTINAQLLARTDCTLVRWDIALSTGGDGSTYNASLMADGVHPNTAGYAAMKARLLLDCPGLFA